MTEEEKAWQKVLVAERECEKVDRQFDSLFACESKRQSETISDVHKRIYTEKERKAAIRASEKAEEKLFKTFLAIVVSVFAIIGAAIVAVFKRKWSPLYTTWDWCKENVWPEILA